MVSVVLIASARSQWLWRAGAIATLQIASPVTRFCPVYFVFNKVIRGTGLVHSRRKYFLRLRWTRVGHWYRLPEPGGGISWSEVQRATAGASASTAKKPAAAGFYSWTLPWLFFGWRLRP